MQSGQRSWSITLHKVSYKLKGLVSELLLDWLPSLQICRLLSRLRGRECCSIPSIKFECFAYSVFTLEYPCQLSLS